MTIGIQDKDFGYRLVVGSNFGKYLKAVTNGVGTYYLTGRENTFLEVGIDLFYLSIDKVSDDQRGFAFINPDYSSKTLYASANPGYRDDMLRIPFSELEYHRRL